MDLNTYINKTAKTVALNKMLVVLAGLMVVALIYTVGALRDEVKKKVTHIVPLSASGPMTIGIDHASDEYLVFMARDIMALAFTYTANNARKQFEELIILFAPEVREQKRRKLLNTAEKIEAVKRVTRTFYIDEIETTKDTITVKGLTVRRLGGRLEMEHATIEIPYRIEFGRFMITDIRRIDGNGGQRAKPQSLPINSVENLDEGGVPVIEEVEDGIR